MKTHEYVTKYQLQNPNVIQTKEMRTNLLKDLSQDLEQRILLLPKEKGEVSYTRFHNLVKEINQKFWAISNKKLGEAFSYNYWNAFYALHIIPLRKKYCPKEHARLEKEKKSKAFETKSKSYQS